MVLPSTLLSWFTMLAFDSRSCDWATVVGTRGGGLKGKFPLIIELFTLFYELTVLILESG